MDGWQRCPSCKGSGIHRDGYAYEVYPPCTVCNGYKIINIITGKPPEGKRDEILKSLITAAKEVLRISDRDHKAWANLRSAIKEFEKIDLF